MEVFLEGGLCTAVNLPLSDSAPSLRAVECTLGEMLPDSPLCGPDVQRKTRLGIFKGM